MKNTPLIQVKNVQQQFTVGDEVVTPLKDVSLTIDSNKFNVVFGPSGSGKSTLLNVIAGLEAPTKGEVWFREQNVYDLNRDHLSMFRARYIGTIYQDNYWIKSLSAIDNVALPLLPLGYSRHEAREKAMKSLQMFGMADYANKPPFILSIGEQQRVAAARAIVNRPLCIVADEPTGSLDAKNADMVMKLLRQTQKDSGACLILVTHNIEHIHNSDTVFQMRNGQLRMLEATKSKTVKDILLDDLREISDKKNGKASP
jgi:putative ABC transport system ATP-binding protein